MVSRAQTTVSRVICPSCFEILGREDIVGVCAKFYRDHLYVGAGSKGRRHWVHALCWDSKREWERSHGGPGTKMLA